MEPQPVIDGESQSDRRRPSNVEAEGFNVGISRQGRQKKNLLDL